MRCLRFERVTFVTAVALAFFGCGEAHDGPGGADGGREGGGGGVACGPTVCEDGLVCCNASCGICVAPGEGCPTIACVDAGADAGGGQVCGVRGTDPCPSDQYCDFPDEAMCGAADAPGTCRARPDACTEDCPGVCGCDGQFHCNACAAASAGVDVDPDGSCAPADCAPMDATGQGACRRILGVSWNGSACVSLGGCECVGTDCDALYGSLEACRDARSDCEHVCGGFAGFLCGDDQYCDYPDGAACGAADATGTCESRPTGDCPASLVPVCGCDGNTYGGACEAQKSGVDVLHSGACEA